MTLYSYSIYTKITPEEMVLWRYFVFKIEFYRFFFIFIFYIYKNNTRRNGVVEVFSF